ncbi:heme ABC transporter ATP-binding protein [Pseudomonas cremoricolorata]|uniref:Hemin ABC transporter ATP-binding protein n=1 Tax=Pseudomonas cremoricolorata TaxID=157783 RepID=A0A089WHX3_9PSED|nr:heme ABC transporter ATP-binding protein [Pseudomonas cremoricolorata]AIR88171.1 hemin ABC transporter ATP-binding protein [Pseudomonas cremoricolorata]
MLQAQGVHVRRGSKQVLQAIDLSLHSGQVLGVLGPNGAGKSSLLGALCGELSPSQGQVLMQGRPLEDWQGPARARSLAVLPQVSSLDFSFSVEEVVGMGRLPHDSGALRDAEIIDQALHAADAQHLHGRSYLALSGGERQRVHLARVLAQLWPGAEGSVLLLDEPTSALDPLHQHTTLQAVREVAQRGTAVLVILHDLNLAARYCDRIVLLHEGRCHAAGTPQQVLTPQALHRVFGIEVLVQAHPERGHPLIIAR